MAECVRCGHSLLEHGYKIIAFDNDEQWKDSEYYCSSSCFIDAYGGTPFKSTSRWWRFW